MLKIKQSELRLYCDLLTQQTHEMKNLLVSNKSNEEQSIGDIIPEKDLKESTAQSNQVASSINNNEVLSSSFKSTEDTIEDNVTSKKTGEDSDKITNDNQDTNKIKVFLVGSFFI